jgi:hypothetical protein
MLAATMASRVITLAATCVLAVSAAAPAAAAPGRPVPGKGGDAVLPSGYQGVLWGISPNALQAVRGRAMETQITPDPHIVLLIETPEPGSDDASTVVQWRFWDEKLFEIHLFYDTELTVKEGVELVSRYEEKYGGPRHEVLREEVDTNNDGRPDTEGKKIHEERWVWEDAFTLQILRRQVSAAQWTCMRRSRMLEASRQVQDEKDREKVRSHRVKSIELD